MTTSISGAEPDASLTELERLALLQEVDQRLRDLQINLSALEGDIRQRSDELAAKQEHVRTLRESRDRLETQKRDLERQLEDEGVAMKDRRMRLNRVRTEKELQAVRREIELGKETTQRLETELLAAMELHEVTLRDLESAEAALEQVEAPASAEITEKRERQVKLQESADRDRGMREQLAERLNRSLRSKYEQIFARRGGVAVVAVRNGTCQGCHMHVPPQLYNEIQKHRDVVRQCPNCHRMLYWRPEAVEE
jgi:predicted  nucleic acid-binding Zn-ribbon protein